MTAFKRPREERHTRPAAPHARAPALARDCRRLPTRNRAVSYVARVRAFWPRSGREGGRGTARAAAPVLPNARAAGRRPLRLRRGAPAVQDRRWPGRARRPPGESAAAQVDNVAHWGDILQLAVLELIRKVCRGAPAEKGRHMKTILALLQSTSTAVVYECAVTLVSLSQARRSRAPRRAPFSFIASWPSRAVGLAFALEAWSWDAGRWHTSLRASQVKYRLVQMGHLKPPSATSSCGPWWRRLQRGQQAKPRR